MSTIRTLQASFKANANEMKAAINGIKSGLNDLKTNSNNASRTMSQRMYGVSKSLKTASNNVGKFSQKTKEIGQSLTKKITVPATAAATAVAGITLVKGFKRLTGIDDARAKLSGLGHDASSTEKIMKSALDSVKGTAYGLDEAATTAASAVAAGIEPGKELTRYLSLTGDAAAIAGTDMSEMGSIFNKVQTAQRAYSGDLNQLADRGIPIYQWLADEAGVTAEEVRDMASDGEISSKMFLNAIDKNIGGAAKKIGEKSFTAALANMWAAVGRLGASFLDAGNKGGGLFSKLKPLINEFTDQLDNMGGYAERAGEKLGDAFTFIVYKVKALKQSYDDLSPSMQSIIKKIALIGSVVAVSIGPVLTVLGMFGNGIKRILSGLSFLTAGFAKVGAILPKLGTLFTALTGPIGITVGVIAALTTGFIIAYKKSETFRNIVHKLKDAFVNAVVGIKEFLTTNPQILAFVDSVKKGFNTLKDNVSKAVKAVAEFVIEKFGQIKSFWDNEGQQLLQAFQNIFKAIWSVVEPIINAIVKLIEFAFPFIKKTIEVAMKLTKSIIQMVWENIKGIIDGALNVIMGLVKIFSGLFTGDFSKMWEGIKQVFSGALKFIWNYVQLMLWGKMLKGILSLGKLMLNAFKGMWNGIRNVFSTVIKWIVDFVKNRFTAMRTTITNITNAIKSVISKIWNGIKDFFSRIIKWIVDFVKKRFEVMKNNISTIFNAVKKFFSTVWNGIKKIFSTVVKSIVDFVKKRFDNLKNNITKVFNGIKTFTKKTWDTIKKYTIDPVKNMVSTAKTKFGELKKSVTDIFGNIKKTITDRVSDMVKTVTDMPGKMKKGIQKGAGKVKDGFKSVSNKMVEGIEKGVNGVIGGVNWAWSKLGGKKNKFSKWTAPKYAKGTGKKGHPGGPAVVKLYGHTVEKSAA